MRSSPLRTSRRSIIINAKAAKQKAVIESEGNRDRVVRVRAAGSKHSVAHCEAWRWRRRCARPLVGDPALQEAEGEAQQIRSRARGEAKAITNAAQAEADSVREVARAISRTGENATRYLLALKYIDALRTILSQRETQIRFVPRQTAVVQTMQSFGVTPSIIAGGGVVA